MKSVKKLIPYSLCIMLAIVFSSCGKAKVEYPKYSLETIEYVPDSLKKSHKSWMIEMVRAASQNMTGGDYEDVDETMYAARNIADELFQLKIVGLRKEINDDYWDDIEIYPANMSRYEKDIYDSLVNNR